MPPYQIGDTPLDRRIFKEAHRDQRHPSARFALDVAPTSGSLATNPTYGTRRRHPSHAESTESYHSRAAEKFATIGNLNGAVKANSTTRDMSVQDVPAPLTELKAVLEQRRFKAHTPYHPQEWHCMLTEAGLIRKYKHIPESLCSGFNLNLPIITNTQTPPNKLSTFATEFTTLVEAEIAKKRYIGPFTRRGLEDLIGSFQSSPFSIIPKPGKPGRIRGIQNYSFPRSPSVEYPNRSINYYVEANDFPTTWGTASLVSLLINRLPPNSQAATRDVSEAYRGIPLHYTQWPAAVVRTAEDGYCVDTAACFGQTSSSGAYGGVADAGAELCRFQGIGPISKWVDDHLFIRIRRVHLNAYNTLRRAWNQGISDCRHQDGSRIRYGGTHFEDGTLDEFDEDCKFPFTDHSGSSPRSAEDMLYTYNFDDIDKVSERLGIPWELSKDLPFASTTTYIGFVWDLANLTVSLGEAKKTKYLLAIQEWQKRATHTLNDVQKVYGKLLHVCFVIPRGRAFLTSLETMLGICSRSPFMPIHPDKGIAADLEWWTSVLQRTSLSRSIPKPVKLIDCEAFSDASSSIGIGITIGNRWRAWRLIPGWQTLDGARDIGWAEAVGFELLSLALTRAHSASGDFRVHGDNQGVLEGWRNNRSHNKPTNEVFKRMHSHLEERASTSPVSIHAEYIPSKFNPADAPSRGILPSTALLLPPIELPNDLKRFLIDATEPYTATELRLRREGKYPRAVAKQIDAYVASDLQRELDRLRDSHSYDI